MNAAELSGQHIGWHAVIRIGTAKTKDRVAGVITSIKHYSDVAEIAVRKPGDTGWQICCLSHTDQIEIKEPKP